MKASHLLGDNVKDVGSEMGITVRVSCSDLCLINRQVALMAIQQLGTDSLFNSRICSSSHDNAAATGPTAELGLDECVG